ncbi:hypothetical protein [Massilia phyllosphaerae]|uniref:hypothetical protein n=1 Tax=Massilia phyllosphaerae TaxID=3106034 RepID=UPI002B1CAFE7|nr:hypothetical protein [Massilia sp. SGZ-792]
MRTSIPTLCSLALACALALSGAAHAQNDAAKAESEGRQAGLKTLQKEIGAAYDEAKRACARGPANERSACLQKARQTRQEDMKAAPAQVQAAGGMGSVTTTRTTTVGDTSTTSVTTTPATAEPGVR